MSARVIAYHVILTCYGFWLPNDERGSGSRDVFAEHLKPFGSGTLHRADGSRSVAHRSFDRAMAVQAKRALKYPAVKLNGRQAQLVGRAIGEQVERDGLTVHALAIMPDHFHALILRSARPIEQVAARLRGAATRALAAEGCHPLQPFAKKGKLPPKMFARGGRFIFLDSDAAIRRTIRYVEQNPMRAGLPPQQWRLVKAYPTG